MEELKPFTFCTKPPSSIRGLRAKQGEVTYRMYTRLVECHDGNYPATIPFYNPEDSLTVRPDSPEWEKYNPRCRSCEMPDSKLCVNGPCARDVCQTCPLIEHVPLVPYHASVIELDT